jgi:predicted RNase H-like HicB family nuclease
MATKHARGKSKRPTEKRSGAIRLPITIDRDEDGIWIVECPSIPGCVSQGSTKQQALVNIRNAIKLCLEVRAERGLPLTVETSQIEVRV